MIRVLILVWFLFGILGAETTIPQLEQEVRVAMVVANGDYIGASMEDAVENGRKMRDFLEWYGFDVLYGENVDKREFARLTREFARAMKPNCLALFYYNGRAVQIRGENYYIPVGDPIATDEQVVYRGIPADTVNAIMRRALNRLNIVIVDAATGRFNSFYTPKARGLAPFGAEANTHFILATQPGSTVRAEGFVDRFIATFSDRPISIRYGIGEMSAKSRGGEKPWARWCEEERFYFILPKSLEPSERAVWRKVHRANTITVYEAFLREYPTSRYVDEARKALDVLRRDNAAAFLKKSDSDT